MATILQPITAQSEKPQSGNHPPISTILDALTFQLARLVAINHQTGTRVFHDEYGLSLNEWRILGLAYALKPATIRTIRKILLMDRGQMSRVVRKISERGLIKTRPSAMDSRTVEVSLTEAGEKLHNRVLKFTAERNALVVGSLTENECREFMRILQKIILHNDRLSALTGVLE
ncbi:MAG: winged helix-turn-helix transcriptional regulator [Hyphomicrobiales bacterium]|nr:winged helix-turn-helix transcriptional regulator [Hyphomicrobiales bacterium]